MACVVYIMYTPLNSTGLHSKAHIYTLLQKCPCLQELERGLEATSKTHAQEMRGLRLRNRALASETNTFRDTANQLHSQLKVNICLHL